MGEPNPNRSDSRRTEGKELEILVQITFLAGFVVVKSSTSLELQLDGVNKACLYYTVFLHLWE